MGSTGTLVGQATIFVEKSGDDIIRIYDEDDQCMKAVVDSFEILADLNLSQCTSGGPQVVFHLRDFAQGIRYITTEGEEIADEHDREVDALYCATTSVLKYLHANQCVGKDVVTFQARRGRHETRDMSVSSLFTIALTQNPTYSPLDYQKGIISRTYAYLSEKQLCMFLNDSSDDTIKKLDSVLSKLFPKVESLLVEQIPAPFHNHDNAP